MRLVKYDQVTFKPAYNKPNTRWKRPWPPNIGATFGSQYTNKTVMRIGGLILNSTKFFSLFESADVLALPNSSH